MRIWQLIVALGFLCLAQAPARAQSLPTSVSDKDFWAMVDGFSEPGGSFASDNIISNEIAFQHVIPELKRNGQQGAYLGVGPEQNFTYITALKPGMAFIIDIRRQNLLLHLMYKALVEMSADRADFMSRLFARPRPAGATGNRTARGLFDVRHIERGHRGVVFLQEAAHSANGFRAAEVADQRYDQVVLLVLLQ